MIALNMGKVLSILDYCIIISNNSSSNGVIYCPVLLNISNSFFLNNLNNLFYSNINIKHSYFQNNNNIYGNSIRFENTFNFITNFPNINFFMSKFKKFLK